MAAVDYLERLRAISEEGPRQTGFEFNRSTRDKIKRDFLENLRLQQQRMIEFAATIPPQDYQRQGGLQGGFPGGLLSMYPLRGDLRVTSPYGVHRKGHKSAHTGIDWASPAGTTIYAPAAGRVRSTRWDKIYGNQTILDIGGGRSLMFGHQSGFNVKPGQSIAAGAPIGYVGSTGWSTGPHLHFETWINNQPVNPLSWFI